MNPDQLNVMFEVWSALRAVRKRDVTEEFGLRKLHVTDVTAEICDELFHTNVVVKAQVNLESHVPDVIVKDGIKYLECKLSELSITRTYWHNPLRRNTPLERAQMVRSTLRNLFDHEIDEVLTVNGERPFDPHKPKMPRRWYFAIFKKRLRRLLGKGEKEDV